MGRAQQIKPILFPKFSNFFTFILGANSYYPREGKAENGKMEFFQPESDTRFSVPGAFKLDHLQPVKPILFSKFSNYIFHFHTWGLFLRERIVGAADRGLENGRKRENFQIT